MLIAVVVIHGTVQVANAGSAWDALPGEDWDILLAAWSHGWKAKVDSNDSGPVFTNTNLSESTSNVWYRELAR